ncbi:hypothetical protein DSTSK_01490 [Desulforhabdus sp. TSK]|nr:hypothetical protein DSTSK_01490 [Desulforhabdus sp. TSK]
MKKPSIVNLAQIRTIDKRRFLVPKLAQLSDKTMAQVDRALKFSLSLS